MDNLTAKELDVVLKEIGSYTNLNHTITKLNREGKMNIRFPIDIYLEYLNDLDLIKNSSGEKYAYYKTIKGLSFTGFEKQVREEKRIWPKFVRNNLLSGMIGTILGAIIGLLGQCLQKPPELNVTNLPIISVVHDTIYINTQKNARDTSLVRIVKHK